MSIGAGALHHKPPWKEQAAADGAASCAFAVGDVRGDAENPAAGPVPLASGMRIGLRGNGRRRIKR